MECNEPNAMPDHEHIDLSGLIAHTHELRFGLGLIGLATTAFLYVVLADFFIEQSARNGDAIVYLALAIGLCAFLFILERTRARPSAFSRKLVAIGGAAIVTILLLAASEAAVMFSAAIACGYALLPSLWAAGRLRRLHARTDVRPFKQTFSNWYRTYFKDRKPRAAGAAVYYFSEAAILWTAIGLTYVWLEVAHTELQPEDGSTAYANQYFAYLSGVLCFFVYRYSFSKFLVAFSVDARKLIEYDPRAPVVLLREFGADTIHIRPRIPFLPRPDIQVQRASTSGIPVAYTKVRLEQVIADELSPVGPVIAIGEPGEAVPKIGASRTYFSDDEWQDGVTEWMDAASVIVVLCGTSQHLGWEIDQIRQRQFLAKTIFVVPPMEHAREACARAALARTIDSAANAVEDCSDMICFVVSDNLIRSYHSTSYHQLDYEFAIAAATRSLLVPAPR